MGSGHYHIVPVLEEYRLNLPPPDKDWPYDVQRGYRCLHENLYDEELNVAELRNRCGIRSKNFSARFRYFVGVHPKYYITFHRIQASKRILLSRNTNGCTLMEIALELGFRSHSTFTKAYQRIEGELPSRIMKKARDKFKTG